VTTIILLALTHAVCIIAGASLWKLLSTDARYRRQMVAQHKRLLAAKWKAERWQLEAEYLGEVVAKMTDVAKSQASLASTKQKASEQQMQILEMADEQERQRVMPYRQG
jgi:uncharacterized protein with ATP-grasp and redox domains